MSVVSIRREISSFSDEQLTQLLDVNAAFEVGIRKSPGDCTEGCGHSIRSPCVAEQSESLR